jgi:DNA-directed RNA polymerase subunit RPC12/RpoP
MDEHAAEFRLRRETQTRSCMSCGKEEETTWGGDEFFCSECRIKRSRKTRACDNCGKEEETTWDKDFFYCSECRAKYRSAPATSAEEAPKTFKATLAPTE